MRTQDAQTAPLCLFSWVCGGTHTYHHHSRFCKAGFFQRDSSGTERCGCTGEMHPRWLNAMLLLLVNSSVVVEGTTADDWKEFGTIYSGMTLA